MLEKSVLEKLCDYYSLGEITAAPQLFRGFHQHAIWHLTTAKGQFAVKNVNNDENELSQLIEAEKMAAHFYQNRLPTITCLRRENNPVFQLDQACFFVYPWLRGKQITSDVMTSQHATQLGVMLARIHQHQPAESHFPPQYYFDYTARNWQQILFRYGGNSELSRHLPVLLAAESHYFSHRQQISGTMLLSHRDLTPSNVIWRDANSPVVIDWEYTGYIHSGIDLFNVAINWAGIENGKIDKDLFRAVLTGYHATMGALPYLDEHSYYASLGSWLAWIANSCDRFLASPNNLQLQHRFDRHFIVTLKALEILLQKVSFLLNEYQSYSLRFS